MKAVTRMAVASVLVLALAACDMGGGDDDAFPTGPVTIVVPYGPGGDTDIGARLTAQYLEEELDESVVVSNVEGAGGTVGSQEVMQADPDGHTLLYNHHNHILNPLLGISDVTYEDFEIVGAIVSDYTIMAAVHGDSEFADINELIEYADTNPGEVTAGVGYGNTSHFFALGLEAATGVEFNIVDVGGGADQQNALLGERVDFIWGEWARMEDSIEAGDFRSLGIALEDRAELLPDEPTMIEQGVDYIAYPKDFFLFAPPETPDDVIDALSGALESLADNTEYQDALAEQYMNASFLSPEDTLATIEEAEAEYSVLAEQFVD